MGDFDSTLGPLLLGVFLNTYIFGGVLLQYCSYHNTRIRDPPYVKYPAMCLLAINASHCMISVYMVWIYCVKNYDNPSALGVAFWVTSATPIFIAVTGLIAHMFLAYRLCVLTKNRIAFAAFTVISVAVFALALSSGIVGVTSNLALGGLILHEDSLAYQGLVKGWLILQVILEAALTGSVGYSLVKCRPQFLPSPLNTTLTRVVRGAVQSGVLTFVFSFAALISGAAGKTTAVFALFSIPISPLYTMVIYDTLLSRRVSLGSPEINSMPENDPTGIWIPVIPKAILGGSANYQSISLQSIHVKTEVYTDGKKETPGRTSPAKQSLDIDVESRHNDELDVKGIQCRLNTPF